MNGPASATIDSVVPTAKCHPLEIIPIFRRVPRSIARDFVYTVIWNSLFAVFFTLVVLVTEPRAPLGRVALNAFVFAQCIGFVVYAGLLVGDRFAGPAIHRSGMWVRAAYYAIVPALAVIPGYLLALRLLNWQNGAEWVLSLRFMVSIVAVSLILSVLLLLIFMPRERAARAEAAMARDEARAAAAEKDATMARLKLLEAQVEPHFLYNTLAHVVSLIDAEPRTAKRMTERLIALLRANAMAVDAQPTLGKEIAWLTAYLEIIELRMGERMRWRIDVPPALYDLDVPPMILQPLVENAVRHGLEPSMAGGELTIAARRNDATLDLTVTDTGVGFSEMSMRSGAGIGLANLRARLAAACADAATMTIDDLQPHGTRVTVRVPVADRGRSPDPSRHKPAR